MSNACKAINPTYRFEIEDGEVVLKTQRHAQYDFEEYRNKTIAEATAEIPEIVANAIKYNTDEIARLECELLRRKGILGKLQNR